MIRKQKSRGNFISDLENQSNIPSEISDYILHIQEIKCWLDHAVKHWVGADHQRNKKFIVNGQFPGKQQENFKNETAKTKPSRLDK